MPMECFWSTETDGRMSMTKSGLACVIVFSCLGVLNCIEFCIFLWFFFVSTLAK